MDPCPTLLFHANHAALFRNQSYGYTRAPDASQLNGTDLNLFRKWTTLPIWAYVQNSLWLCRRNVSKISWRHHH